MCSTTPISELPNAVIGTTTAGVISSTVSSPRQNQFAMKLMF